MDIKSLREQKNYTQETLAQKAGISIRTLQRIEAGQKPKGHTANVLAKALGIEVSKLISEEKEAEENIHWPLVKLINLSSLIVVPIPFLNIILPLSIAYFSKQINSLTRQIISLQIFWTITSFLIFFISAFIKNAFALTNQFSLWTMVLLILINVVLIIINTASMDKRKELLIKLSFSFI
ncbi:helix-turn-helix domain-containing protein [Flavobacteriaceae bacterium M23B6Z8]